MYIAETILEVRKRISRHKSTIRTGLTDLPIPKNIIEKSHTVSQLRYRVIDSVPPLRRGKDRMARLREKELMWIHKLDTLAPRRLNWDFNLHAIL